MRCLGSNQHLKNKFGSGYRLVLNIKEEFAGHVQSFVAQLFPGSTLLEAGKKNHTTYPLSKCGTY